MKSFIMNVNLSLNLIFKMRYAVFEVIRKSASLTVFLGPISYGGLDFFKDGGQIYTSSHFVIFG